MGSDRKKDEDSESDPDNPDENEKNNDKPTSKESVTPVKTLENKESEAKKQNGEKCVVKSNMEQVEEVRKWARYGDQYTCRVCYKEFAHKRSCKVHQNTMHGINKSFNCTLCEKVFSNTTSLNYHKSTRHMDKFKCKNCQKEFQTYKELRKHRRAENRREELPDTLKCKDCGKMVLRKNMRRHQRNVHVYGDKNLDLTRELVKPFKCDQCDTKFNREDNLKAHMTNTHSKIVKQRYSCDTCNKTFSRNQQLNAHIAIKHSLLKTFFKCKICGKIFNKKGNLKEHNKSVKCKYLCKNCDKTFLIYSQLQAHIAIKHS